MYEGPGAFLVPTGESFWEVGTGDNAQSKATSDYKDLTASIPKREREAAVFTFVTPLSGRIDWPHTWKKQSKLTWIRTRRLEEKWKDVRVVDGTMLVDWMRQFPAVERWFASQMGIPSTDIESLTERWDVIKRIGAPPELSPDVLLAGREMALTALEQIFENRESRLQFDTKFPEDIPDFVAAAVSSLDEERRVDISGRALIVSSPEAWKVACSFPTPHILVASPALNLATESGRLLIEKATQMKHSCVFPGQTTTVEQAQRQALLDPGEHKLEEALKRAGYAEERARVTALKSNGNTSALFRQLQNVPLQPSWAEAGFSNELVQAQFFGSWREADCSDREIVGKFIAPRSISEWTDKLREGAGRPQVPITYVNGTWSVSPRFETWNALASRVYDAHLNHFKDVAMAVLGETNPKFELPKEKRYMAAGVYGKRLSFSGELRQGIAETIAYLGCYPDVFTNLHAGRAENFASHIVTKVLTGGSWEHWATIDGLLPLLGEAAPQAFLSAVEAALAEEPSPLEELFSQESTGGVFGENHLVGLLWALEGLAWNPELLPAVTLILGDLALRDPGGNSANRPINSLRDIYLPGARHTVADLETRADSIVSLLNSQPIIGWKLLINLLPQSYGFTTGTRKPVWRPTIPSDWSSRVTNRQFWEQVVRYFDIALEQAAGQPERLSDLIDKIDDLHPDGRTALLKYLTESDVAQFDDQTKEQLWTSLVALSTKHKKYSDAGWALKPDVLALIDEVAAQLQPLTPSSRFRRLFVDNEHDLYNETDDFRAQMEKIESQRCAALQQILEAEGEAGVLTFLKSVESLRRAGYSAGSILPRSFDRLILPEYLEGDDDIQRRLVGGYLLGRFVSGRWKWVDDTEVAAWSADQRAQFFALLPFSREAWTRAKISLGAEVGRYWALTSANPHDAEKDDLYEAAALLTKFGRPFAATDCIWSSIHAGQPFQHEAATDVLLATFQSKEDIRTIPHQVNELIGKLQATPESDKSKLATIELTYIKFLGTHRGEKPKTLFERLAQDPDFFCEAVRYIFRSANEVEKKKRKKLSAAQEAYAGNVYRMLTDWNLVPGANWEGNFDVQHWVTWLAKVKDSTKATGHFDSAMTMLGEVLVHCPPDPSGLWIAKPVAAAMNGNDGAQMRAGFRTGLYNLRGVHSFTNGAEEATLAQRYREKASALRKKGFLKLAAVLSDLASDYENEGKHAKRTGRIF